MADIAIRVERLSKSYRISHKETDQRYRTLQEDLVSLPAKIASGFRGIRRSLRPQSDLFWALDNVSFEVNQGEVLGIIGRNGAGKSTLLKILSRVTEPCTGRVEVYGRVGSLLEVGTGFHPELTGRENIYLNGAILGMSRQEIKQRFDAIVDFAEVEDFLDVPVKRYSSGMYVRLAFAVAAHLDPEILIIDEVLAVGDAAFQKKCLGKMGSVANEGRTVLFVSHNLTATEAICSRCIGLRDGQIAYEGSPSNVIGRYLGEIAAASSATSVADRIDRVGTGEARFTQIRLLNENDVEVTEIPMGAPLILEASYIAQRSIRDPVFGFMVADGLGRTVLRAYSHESYPEPIIMNKGIGIVRCRFHNLPLMHGRYELHLWLSTHRHPLDYLENAVALNVTGADVYGTGRIPDSNNGGSCYATHSWEISK